MQWVGSLQRKDSASCRGAILRPHQLMDELRLWNITVWVGSEGRAQNIAPLHLIRCLIVECSGMDIPSTRCCTIWDGRGFVRFMPLVSLPGGSRHDRPSEAHRSRFRYLQASPRLHGVVHDMPSPMAGLPPRLRGGWQRGGGGSEAGWGGWVLGYLVRR